MNRFENITKPLMWFMALLLTAFMAGCGGGGGSSASTPTSTAADKSINTYSIAWSTGATGSATGIIDQTLKTIKMTVPHATLLTPMTATFTASAGASVTVDTVLQVSGSTNNDFMLPVSYKVTAADGTWATYTVLVSRDQTVTSLSVSPATASTPAGATFQFAAIATYLDLSTDDVTTTADWTPDSSGNATVGLNTGLATGVAVTPAGTPVVITATIGTVSDTAALTVTAPPGPNLRRTASFAVLSSGSTITNAGTTTVTTGDVGSTGQTIAGTLTVSNGTNYPLGTEQPYVDAKADLPTVLSDANSTVLFPCGTSISGDLSGVALTPGVTCILSNAAILNTGIVTLNGPGVYIIRTTGSLTPAAGSSVAYGTGATALNTTVYWVVGSANITSSVGTPVIWKGTILTGGAVTLGDSATLVNGRVLATGAVSLTGNTITRP